jgi:thymidylate synthase
LPTRYPHPLIPRARAANLRAPARREMDAAVAPPEAAPGPPTTTSAERAYLDLVARVLARGVRKTNRTGTDTLSSFAEFYTVDLAEGYPLLTTKKVFFGSMLREVLWYLSGEPHVRTLQAHTGIWDAWADDEGRLETAYGRFWRRFPLPPAEAFEDGERWAGEDHPHVRREAGGALVFDQLGHVADLLRRDPMSRRMLVTAWHPANAAVSKLPPCHYTFAFHVEPADDGPPRLNAHLTQRSADLALGVPFNLACYALLTEALAAWAGMRPGRFAHTLVDCHVYLDHVAGLREQLTREPLPAPRLTVARHADGAPKALDELAFEDVTLEGYRHHEAIRFPVAV